MESEIKGNLLPENRICSPQGRYIRLDERLGSGAYKDVWRAYDTNEGFEVAWNVIKLNRVPPNERKRIKTEVKLLKDLEHPNVIKYHNSWVNREKEEIVFVTEIMSSGSLKDYIKKNPMIRWNAVKRWCVQILKGLEFLHSKQIIHRDIKCDNIFINGSTGDIRIGDLGLSTKIAEGNVLPPGTADKGEIRQITAAAMTCLGTPEFMAPELYDENYNEKVDIYAFGMSCLEMVTALTPYHDCTSAAQIYKKVINGELPPELSLVRLKSARSFIEACLLPGINRPSATELLSYEFLSPNEEDDFLEVRVRLESVPETLSSNNSDDDEDNSDEEQTIHYISREINHIVSTSSTSVSNPTSPHNHNHNHNHNQNNNNNNNNNNNSSSPVVLASTHSTSNSSEENIIKSSEIINDKLNTLENDHNLLIRSKTLSEQSNEQISNGKLTNENSDNLLINRSKNVDSSSNEKSLNQINQKNTIKENTISNTSNSNKSSPEKVIKEVLNETLPKTPIILNSNSEIILSEDISVDDSTHKRRSSGNSSMLQEFKKTSSRVLRVCLSDSGHRGRSSSFIDIPLSPMSQDLTYDQYSVLPSSTVKNSENISPQNIGINLTQEFHDSLNNTSNHDNFQKLNNSGNASMNVNGINSNNNNDNSNSNSNNNSNTSNNSHQSNNNNNNNNNNYDNNNSALYSVPKYSKEENFLGVVDVGDKGLDLNGSTNENCLIFRLRVPFENTFKEIEFEFDLLRDNPQTIVDEMNEVDELMFLSSYAKQIVDSLTPIVEAGQRVLKEKIENNTDKYTLSNLVLQEFLATAEKYDDRALAALSASRAKSEPLIIPMEPKLELSFPPPSSTSSSSTTTITTTTGPPSVQQSSSSSLQQQQQQQPLSQPQPQRISSHNLPIQLNLPEIKPNPVPVPVSVTKSSSKVDNVQEISRDQSDDHLLPKPSKTPSRNSFPSSTPSDNHEKGINSVASTPSSSYVAEKILNSSPTKVSLSESESLSTFSSQNHHELSTGSYHRSGNNSNNGEISSQEDNTQKILDDNDPEYQLLYSKYLESVAKIEKEHNHIKTNISSQKDKVVENYRREYEKLVNRQNDLNKQLVNMEERFKERMSDFSQRKQQLYLEYINKHPRKNRNIT